MKKEAIKNILINCPDLERLSGKELDMLISIGEVEVFRKGEQVFTINHKGEKFYIVLEGRLLLRLKDKQSKEYRKGKLFGEVAILGNTCRFGTICAAEESMLISFNRNIIFTSQKISRDLALKIVLLLCEKMVSYFDTAISVTSRKLIEKGESDQVEFKASIDKYQKISIVKTLAAFLNFNGGTIFCGVEDERGIILGIDNGQKEIDNFKRALTGEIKYKLGAQFLKYISFDIEEIDKRTIIRIDCNSSNCPVFYKEINGHGEEKELFFLRTGPENNKKKKISHIIEYIKERF